MDFKAHMENRLTRWYKSPANDGSALSKRRQYVASLVNKSIMHNYAFKKNIPLPTVYGNFKSVKDIDFPALPERVVIKPNNSADSDCVMLFSADHELLSGSAVGFGKPIRLCRASVFKRSILEFTNNHNYRRIFIRLRSSIHCSP